METKDLPGHYRHGGEVRGSRRAAPAKKNAAAMLSSMPQGYADGGVVQAVKGFFGFKKKPEPLPADLNKLPPTGAGPAPAPSQPKPKEEPKKAISQYSGMSALERRMKEADAYADGGLVRGPGTGISDDIEDEVEEGTFIMPADSTEAMGKETMEKLGNAKVPVNLSNGEAKLPPEALQAIGAEVMEAIKNVTHTPAAVQAKGFPGAQQASEPGNYFADGGVVGKKRLYLADAGLATQERLKREGMTIADRARQPAFSVGAGTYTPKPAVQPAAQPAQAQPAPVSRQAVPAPAAPRTAAAPAPSASSAMAAMPSQKPAAPAPAAAAPTLPTDVRGWRTKAVIDGAAEDAQAAWDRGSPMAAAGSVIRGAVTAVPTAVVDVGRDLVDLIGKPLGNFYDGLTGNTPTPAAAPVAPSAAQKLAAPPAAPVAANPAVTPPTTQPKPEANKPKPEPAKAPDPNGPREVMPGVYRQGNSYGDSPEAAASGARPSQGPSARNISAADVLASRSGQQPVDVMGIYARASEALKGVAEAQRALDDYGPRMSGGGDLLKGGRASAQQFQQDSLRTALVQQAAQGGRGGAAAMQALNGMEGNQIQREIAQMREQGDTARFNAREAGETTRAGMRSAADARRDGLAAELGRGKLDLERTAQGYANSSLARQEKLYAEYDAAETPEKRAAIAQKIRDMSGREQSADWQVQVTPQTKNLDGSTTEGSVYRYNKRTGDVQRVDGGQTQAPGTSKFEKGKTYTDANGNRATWDGTKFNPT